jgi:hypothetical protein
MFTAYRHSCRYLPKLIIPDAALHFASLFLIKLETSLVWYLICTLCGMLDAHIMTAGEQQFRVLEQQKNLEEKTVMQLRDRSLGIRGNILIPLQFLYVLTYFLSGTLPEKD